VLEEGNRNDWFEDRTIAVLAVVAAIALIGFVTHELEHEHPVVDLRVFRNRAYSAATLQNFLVGTAIFAGSVVLSLYCGNILHYRALDIGRVFLLGTWIQLFIFPLVGRIVKRIDPRLLLLVSNAAIITSLWLNGHLTADVTTRQVAFPLFVRAIGTGFGFVPLTVLAVASLPPAQRPGGTALFNLTRELGASIGTAFTSTMISRQTKQAFTFISSHVDAYGSLAAEQRTLFEHGPGARLFDPQGAALALLNQRINAQALLKSFNNTFLSLAFAFLAASWVILLMRRPQSSVEVSTH